MDLSALHTFVLGYAPGVPGFVIDRALLACARDVARDTGVLRTNHVLSFAAGQSDVVVPAVADTTPHRLGQAVVGGQPLHLVSGLFFLQDRSGSPTQAELASGSVRVYPTPTEAVSVKVEIQRVPAADAKTLPDEFADRYRDCLAHGALAYLLMQQGTPWYDPAKAETHRGEHRRLLGEARFDKVAGANGRANHVVIPPVI